MRTEKTLKESTCAQERRNMCIRALVELYGAVQLQFSTDRFSCDTAYYLNCHTVFYRNYGKIQYGVRYGAKLALPVEEWPLHPKTSHLCSLVCSSHVLTPHMLP
jgi:hypothetical protein